MNRLPTTTSETMPKPTLVLSVLLLATVLGWSRAVRAIEDYAILRDDVERQAVARAQALRAGESLPELLVVDHRGQRLSLGDLHRSGVRHFYFFRGDCAACTALEPYLLESPVAAGQAFARIAYSRRAGLPQPTAPGTYAVIADALPERRHIASVPAFFTATEDGRVAAAADFEFRAVVGLLDLARVVDGPALLSALATQAPVSSAESEPASDRLTAPASAVRLP